MWGMLQYHIDIMLNMYREWFAALGISTQGDRVYLWHSNLVSRTGNFLDLLWKHVRTNEIAMLLIFTSLYSSQFFLNSSTQTFEWMQNVLKMARLHKSQKCTLAQEIWSGSPDHFFSLKSVVKSGHETTAHSCMVTTTLPSNPIEVTTIVFIARTWHPFLAFGEFFLNTGYTYWTSITDWRHHTHSKLRLPFLLVRFSYKYGWGGGAYNWRGHNFEWVQYIVTNSTSLLFGHCLMWV